MSDHWHAIEAAFKQLGWNMTPVHMARAELELYVGYVNEYEPRMRKAELQATQFDNGRRYQMARAQKAEAILKRIADEGHANPKDEIIALAAAYGDHGCDTNPIKWGPDHPSYDEMGQ